MPHDTLDYGTVGPATVLEFARHFSDSSRPCSAQQKPLPNLHKLSLELQWITIGKQSIANLRRCPTAELVAALLQGVSTPDFPKLDDLFHDLLADVECVLVLA